MQQQADSFSSSRPAAAAAAPPAPSARVRLNSPAAGKDPSPSTAAPSDLPASEQPAASPTAAAASAASCAVTVASVAFASSASSASSPPLLPRWFVVFYAVIKDTDGRDKALKCLQYGLRYIRWAVRERPHAARLLTLALLRLWQTAASLPSSRAPLPASAVDAALSSLTERLELLASNFSSTRKTIRLFKWCYTIPTAWKTLHKWRCELRLLQAQQGREKAAAGDYAPRVSPAPPALAVLPLPLLLPGLPALPLLSTVELSNNVLAVLTDLSDDADWYSKHRLLPASWNARAARCTIVLWFITVVVDLALSTRTVALQLTELQRCRIAMQQTGAAQRGARSSDELAACSEAVHSAALSLLKFAADFGVALPSLYKQQNEREGLVQFMGCLSAAVATYKLIMAVK